MQSACLAAQQPQLLPYATPKPAALQAAAAKAAAARAPTPDIDGDVFHSPAASPQPASSHARNHSSSRSSSGAAGAAGAPHSSSAGAAAAAAQAAAEAWRELPGFHLSMLAALGPLFDAEQQGPCLVRFMQLLLQYRTDCATAAAALQQRLSPELQRRRLWVPPGASSSSSSSGGGGGGGGGGSCSSDSCVSPDRSRLLVLLMGLYHLQVLSEQQYQQQLQQLQELQEQQGQGWEQQHGSNQLKEQQQQPSRQRSRQLPTASSAQTAAAAGASLYDDLQQRCKFAAEAASVAYSMGDLLLYCIGVGDPQAAGILPRSAASAGSSSSGSRPGGSSPVQRFVVCGLSRALVRDGLLIQAQHGQYNKGTLRIQGSCDFCGSQQSFEIFSLGPLGALRRPAAAQHACDTCGSRSVFCDVCWNSGSVRARHGRCCRAGGALQHAHLDALAEVMAANGELLNVQDDSNFTGEDPCTCDVCNAMVKTLPVRSLISWINMPLSQLNGPWGFLEQSCLLPVAGFCELPQHIEQLRAAAAGRLGQHNGLHNAYLTPLQALFGAFELRVARHKAAAAAANASSSHGSKAGSSSSSSNAPYGSQQRHAAAHSGAAAADAFGRTSPKSKRPEGLGGSSGLRREARQQQQQQGQPAGMNVLSRLTQHFGMPAGNWGAGLQPGPAPDPDEVSGEPQTFEEALHAFATAGSPEDTRLDELD